MKSIYLSRVGKTIEVKDLTHQIISVYKVFFPPEREIKLGKTKTVKLKDIELTPPPEQEQLL